MARRGTSAGFLFPVSDRAVILLIRGDETPVEPFCVFCSEIKVLSGLLLNWP
jgi:hypothetical protein